MATVLLVLASPGLLSPHFEMVIRSSLMNIYTGDVCDTSELVTSRTAPASTALVQHDSRLEGSSGRALILTRRTLYELRSPAWKACAHVWVGTLVQVNNMGRQTEDKSAQLCWFSAL